MATSSPIVRWGAPIVHSLRCVTRLPLEIHLIVSDPDSFLDESVEAVRNGARLRLWKWELQTLADETGRALSVCHFPPGTSKWNKVEHRLFSFISSNWRGEPLRDYETIVHLIARTTTAKGLKVICRLDRRKYRTGRAVSDAEMQTRNLERDRVHGDWNYVIKPRGHGTRV